MGRLGVLAGAAAVLAMAVVAAGPGGAQGPNAVKKLNPFTGKEDAIKEGRALYIKYGCSGCHGVMGGGGMALPLIDDKWKFGSSDEMLYKLVKGRVPEATMPRVFGEMPDEEVWKILAYVRSLYAGDPGRIDW